MRWYAVLGRDEASGRMVGTLVEASDFIAALAYARRWPRLADCWDCDADGSPCRDCDGTGVIAVDVKVVAATRSWPLAARRLSHLRWRWLGR